LENFEDHPVVISSMFLKAHSGELYFANLILPPLKMKERRELRQLTGMDEVEINRVLKIVKKSRFLPYEPIRKLNKTGGISTFKLMKELISSHITRLEQINKALKAIPVSHNTINRFTGRTLTEGGFFTEEEWFLDSSYSLCFLIKDSFFGEKKLRELLDYLSETGYGKNKSTGKGIFSYDLDEIQEFDEGVESNAFINLSLYLPSECESVRGFYKIQTKIGRLGELFSSLSIFYKTPLFFLKEGSIIFTEGKKDYYGKLEKDVYKEKGEIKHYGLAFPYHIKFEEEP
jgi:CRISPR type III-A-associated RAMP protein Csm4